MNSETFEERELLMKEEGYALMGAAFEVHNEVGGGLAEEVYHECLEVELRRRGIPFESKREIAIHYKGETLRRRYIPDLVVHEGLIVELKSVEKLLTEHTAQLFNYLRLSKRRVGYLINFAPLDRLEYRRLVI